MMHKRKTHNPWPKYQEEAEPAFQYDPEYVHIARGLLNVPEDECNELLAAIQYDYNIRLIQHIMGLERVRTAVKALKEPA